MWSVSRWWLLLSITLLSVINGQASQVRYKGDNRVKSAVFLSPEFVLGSGSVGNKFFYDIDFPRGHIALKEFNAEVVDKAGNPVPLHETYLHHWLIARYYGLRDGEVSDSGDTRPKRIIVSNSGICQDTLGQYFGLGSETRRTATYVPDPYGIVVGDPEEIPDGYDEKWILNVHAIDTRHVEDRLGCTECRCDLYNVTVDEHGRQIGAGYDGGLYCCYDETQCRLREGYTSVKRSLYLRYTIKWVDWEDSIVPVRIYIFDVTKTGEKVKSTESPLELSVPSGCKVEYNVESCGVSGVSSNNCIDNKKTNLVMPNGGYVIYGVAHQHSGGIGAALYGEDGRVICSSMAVYGDGKEAGNEAGYIVGMSTCYPQLGSVKISDGETLYFESNYSSSRRHTGVMGLFYLLIADQAPQNTLLLHEPVQERTKLSNYSWAVIFMGVAMVVAAAVVYHRRNERDEGYRALVI